LATSKTAADLVMRSRENLEKSSSRVKISCSVPSFQPRSAR